MKKLKLILFILLGITMQFESYSYPYDGYYISGIRRLVRLQLIMMDVIKDTKPVLGAQKSIKDIHLNLMNAKGDSLDNFPVVDPILQKSIDALFPNMHESYSLCILDITPGKPIRYAKRQEKKGLMPGSVAKLAVIAGLFNELQKLYPDSFELRQELMRSRKVRAGKWANYDEHTVPFYNLETQKFHKAVVKESDTCSLYEWADHMISASNNAAASIVWKEALLMHAFGDNYPPTTEEEAEFFSKTPKSELTKMAVAIVDEPLRNIGITTEEFKLGSMFTRDAKTIVPGAGGTIASPYGLMKYLIAMERGKIIDPESSLEIKRLMYATDRRIRYAASTALTNAAVYFKSGSLYKCKPEEGFECKKYHGNVNNYMNSVAVIEQPDGTIYMVTLMSNVLRKNSANDHFALASQIDKVIRKK
ncbi:MAG: serine hydrolase [Bacteroidales bacterium]